MHFKYTLILFMLFYYASVDSLNVYSSFWAPLYNPRILNYRVDASFDPEAGRNARASYEKAHGYRGQLLIEDLGRGKVPNRENKNPGDVKFYYTYKGYDSEE